MSTNAFPINPTLQAIAIAYTNKDTALIADEVLPRVPTGKKFNYPVWDQVAAYSVPNTVVGRRGEPNTVDFQATDVSDQCVDYGLDDSIPVDDIEAFNAMPKAPGAVGPKEVRTMLLTKLIMLDREIRVGGLVFNSANYKVGLKTSLGAGDQFNDTTSDPIALISNALDLPLVRPNIMVIGQAAWTKLSAHPDIVQATGTSGGTSGLARAQAVAELFGLSKVVIGAARLNNARKGQAPNWSNVWGKHVSLLYVSQADAQMEQPTYGWTAQFGPRVAGDIPEPKKGLRGCVAVRVGESVKEVISSQDSGYFIENAVA